MKICDGTFDHNSSSNYATFECDLKINCTQGMTQCGSRWACHESKWNRTGVLEHCTQDICFKCWPASASPATAQPGGIATPTDVGSAGSGDGDSTLAPLPTGCADAIHTLSQCLQQTASLQSKIVELEAQVTQVTKSASEKCESLEKETQALQAKIDQQNGVGIDKLSRNDLMALYDRSISTAAIVGEKLQKDTARQMLIETHKEYLCVISQELMTDPVSADDGHTYERKEIEAWFEKCQQENKPARSPQTNKELENTKLIPNFNLKKAMQTSLEHTLEFLVITAMHEKMTGRKRKRESNP
jgi:hypothetical protein